MGLNMRRLSLLLLALLLTVSGCAGMGGMGGFGVSGVSGLEVVAESQRQWTGVAVSKQGRIFVCYPRWSDDVPVSVAELLPDGRAVAYPDEEWNTWNGSLSPRGHFVCVQSVYVDDDDNLWILDPANPKFEGVIETGPKLVKVDLSSDTVAGRYYFDEFEAPAGSYLNDVRVDTKRGYAYITDSGLGAIVVVNLDSRRSRRLLEFDPSTKSEGVTLTIEGMPWLRPDGAKPVVHSDGIALSPDGEWLYYQALTGNSLYRVRTRMLRDVLLPSGKLSEAVELVGTTGPADGIMFGPDGALYITAIQEDAIKRCMPGGSLETVISDRRLEWPDSFARGPENTMYVTTSQIHLWGEPTQPYRVLRFRVHVPEEE